MGIVDIAVLTFLAVWFLGTVIYLIKKKKKGGCVGCSGGACANCPKGRKHN